MGFPEEVLEDVSARFISEKARTKSENCIPIHFQQEAN
jgi:hypothetical protein